MMLRNFIIALAIVGVGFVGAHAVPVAAQTNSTTGIQVQIDALLAQIKELTAQINRLRGLVSDAPAQRPDPSWGGQHRICKILARNLSQGTQGDDVMGLQEFLRDQGHFSGNATGYYGPVTASAVARWQSAEGVSAVGSFGPVSRERIMRWCGGNWQGDNLVARPNRGDAPLTVNFHTKVGGFRPANIWYVLDYGDGTSDRPTECYAPADACVSSGTNTHTYTQNGTYTATLNRVTDPCPDDGDPNTPRCMAAIHQEVIGKVQINVGPIACTKEYMPVCGAKPVVCITYPCNPVPTTYGNKCEMNADGARLLYEGQCRGDRNPADDPQCKSWNDGCNTCSREYAGGPIMCTQVACARPTEVSGSGTSGTSNSETQSIAVSSMPRPYYGYCTTWFNRSDNKPPVISGFSGPTTLGVSQSGTWTINASDPENGQLHYSIRWGDEIPPLPGNAAYSEAHAVLQTTTFTHSYASAGTYTIVIMVTDSSGQQARTSATVRVGEYSVCTADYSPVCGRPPGCKTCEEMGYTSGQCPAICALKNPQTYSNRCNLNSANATLLYEGQCQN